MGRKCFISFKTADIDYKLEIQSIGIDMVDKSLNQAIDSYDEDYIMRKIREDYLSDSTVTIFLIGQYSAENCAFTNQVYIKRELQASLYNGKGNTRNGVLGIVLPNMTSSIYGNSYACANCGKSHNIVNVTDYTTIKEFHCNYYIPKDYGCGWADDDRYCILSRWDEFKRDPERYIEYAFKKRTDPIAEKVRVRP